MGFELEVSVSRSATKGGAMQSLRVSFVAKPARLLDMAVSIWRTHLEHCLKLLEDISAENCKVITVLFHRIGTML